MKRLTKAQREYLAQIPDWEVENALEVIDSMTEALRDREQMPSSKRLNLAPVGQRWCHE